MFIFIFSTFSFTSAIASLLLLFFFFFFFFQHTKINLITIITTIIRRLKSRILRRPSGDTSQRLPPGSLGWPVVGETMEFISCAYSDRPESFMDERRRRYGKVFKSHIFGKRTIVSTEEEVSRYILQSDSAVFVPCYPKSLTDLMGKASILVINGGLQRRIHGLLASFFKSPAVKAQIAADLTTFLHRAMDSWPHHSLIFLQHEAKTIAFQVLVKALISLDQGPEMELLKRHFQEFISGLMCLPINIPGTQLHRSLQAKEEMVKVVKRMMEERRRGPSVVMQRRDVLGVLMADTSGHLTDDLISDNMVDMMIPGEDSVPILITLAVNFLSHSPIALHQLTEENMKLKRHKAEQGEEVCWSDYMSLQFTQMVITETLRVGNIITGVMRKAMRDVEIKGHFIPKGWCVLAYFRSVHLDTRLYDKPYSFNPWRWQDKDPNSCHFTPFGGGQRLCPGLDLARLEVSVFLHHFVTRFRWTAEEDFIVHFPTVRMKRGLPLRIIS
ncbi:hypothetical protein V2J09_011023 [Rumex salicifolius]